MASMRLKRAVLPAVLIGFAALAVFARIGQRALWEDEAETALLARQALARGLPFADGDPLISQQQGMEIGWNGLWTWTPWAQIYTAAASMAAFGDSAAGARLLFALIGIAGLWVFYRLALEFFERPQPALLALFFACTSVPLLLHFRQCRWYSLGFLEFTALWLGYLRAADGRPGGRRLFYAGLAALFFTHQPSFLLTCLALAAAHFYFRPRDTLRLIGPEALLLLALVPWLLVQSHFQPGAYHPNPKALLYYLGEINAHHLPLFLLLAWTIAALFMARKPVMDERTRFAGAFFAMFIVMLSLSPFPRFYRYLVAVLPLIFLLQAAVAFPLLAKMPKPAAAFMLLGLTATNVFHLLIPLHVKPLRLQLPLSDYLAELTRPFPGPITALADYLNAHAKPGDVVWATYGDLPLRFHTRLRIYGGLSGERFPDLPQARWIVDRWPEVGGPRGWDHLFGAYIREHVDLRDGYRKIVLNAPDVPWESRPEPDEHFFRYPDGFPPVVFYQKLEN